jgi:hypothetical protein
MYKCTHLENIAVIKVVNNLELLVPCDPGNRHYIEYQEWLAAGNTPEPAPIVLPPPPPPPTIDERLEAAETLIDMMLEAGGEASNG